MSDSTTLPPNRFFVYVLKRPDGRPFYVGKGTARRPKRHEVEARRGCECRRCRTIRKVWREGGQVEVESIAHDISEEDAFLIEIATIERIGRAALCNHTDGGGGTTGLSLDRHPSHLYPHIRRADKNGNTEFTWEIVHAIRAQYAGGGVTAETIASERGVGQSCIYRIIRNHVWIDPSYIPPDNPANYNVPDRRGENNANTSLTWDVIRAVRERFSSTAITYKQLAAEFDLSPANANRIILNKAWHDPDYVPPDAKRRFAVFRRSTDDHDTETRALYASGWTYEQLAEYRCCSIATVWKIVNHKRAIDS